MNKRVATLVTGVWLGLLFQLTTLATADTWKIPAELEFTPEGLRARESFCSELSEGDLITKVEKAVITKKSAGTVLKNISKRRRTLTLEIVRDGESAQVSVETILASELAEALKSRKQDKQRQAKEDERQKKAEAQKEREAWLSTTKFVDRQGKAWTFKDIDEVNKVIKVGVERAILQHRDHAQDSRAKTLNEQSLGEQIALGSRVISTLESVVQTPPGESYAMERTRYDSEKEELITYTVAVISSPADYMQKAGADYAAQVEKYFSFTDGDQRLVPCRDGSVKTAEEVWEEAVAARFVR